MSWDTWLSTLRKDEEGEGEVLEVERFIEGGTYVLGGSTVASLNITWNYSEHYYRVLGLPDGLRSLDGMEANEAIPFLKKGIKILGVDQDNDYWNPTPGNAGYALNILKQWCQQAIRTKKIYYLHIF